MKTILKTTIQYQEWLKQLKQKVVKAQLTAAVAVNQELIYFYWDLGEEIVSKQQRAQWGSGLLKQLSTDLMAEFPEMKGFSRTNLQYIKRWYLFYTEESSNCATACCTIEPEPENLPSKSKAPLNVEQAVPHLDQSELVAKLTKIPWGHNLVIISKCEGIDEALFYVQQTIENSWSRSVLTHQIESQ